MPSHHLPTGSRPRPPASPTGDQWLIGHGRQQAVVAEVGATLRSYVVDGRPVLDGFGGDDWSHGGRGQVLAPWPNRLEDGRYGFEGRELQLALDEPERNNAIHGLVRWSPWQLESQAQNVVVARCTVHPTPGYPFTLELRIEYRLGRQGLTVATSARNVGAEPLPFGLGFHPYLTVGAERVDSTVLQVPARCWMPTDDRGLPTGERRSVSGTELDFTAGRPIGSTVLDTAYSDLEPGPDGVTRARLRHPSRGEELEIWLDQSFCYLMAFTGDTLAAGQRRRSVALEPMTCPPNALRSGESLEVLDPGSEWTGSWGLSPSPNGS